MKQTIYISGPITDNRTGLPREGWEQDFREAEECLSLMGFEVINPIDLAKQAEAAWQVIDRNHNKAKSDWQPTPTPRWFYLRVCIATLCQYLTFGSDAKKALQSMTQTGTFERTPLAGLYVIGHRWNVEESYGTMTEINFALSAGLPVWAKFSNDQAITNLLKRDASKPSLQEFRELLND